MLSRLCAATVVGLTLLIAGTPALAQVNIGRADDAETATSRERTTAGRLNERQRANQRNQAAAPTPEQNKAAADALIAATSSTCQTTEVVLRGQIGAGQNAYEVACATGPGLVLIGSTPPEAIDCVALFGQADIARAADPDADVGLQCQIEANKDVLKVIKQYATEAGVACTVDAGSAVGKNDAGLVYEVGCAGADGLRLAKASTGWTKTSCFQIVSTNGTCSYTTPAEQSATLKGWLASSAASGCDVSQGRYMGANANGSFYEAKCAAGDGLIVRFDTAMAVQQVYPCEVAQRIGGGCTLTIVPPAPAAAAPAAQ